MRTIASIVAVAALAGALVHAAEPASQPVAPAPAAPSIKVSEVPDVLGPAMFAVALRLADGDEGPILHMPVGGRDQASWGPDASPKSTFTATARRAAADPKQLEVDCLLTLNERGAGHWHLAAAIAPEHWVAMQPLKAVDPPLPDLNKPPIPGAPGGQVMARDLFPGRVIGILGRPLGTRLVIQGKRGNAMLAQPLQVDEIDGKPLKPVVIDIRGKDIKANVMYRLEGYEAGEFSGPPDWLRQDVQSPFQYRSFFVVTKVIDETPVDVPPAAPPK